MNSERRYYVNYVEVWETKKTGELVYHNAWVTDVAVTAENVAEIVGIGRAKWKIENEHFNVQKNQGYELEHNYGHGEQNLSHNFYLLNLLAFVAHKILEHGDRRYQSGRQSGVSRRELWNGLRLLMQRFLVAKGARLRLEPAGSSPVKVKQNLASRRCRNEKTRKQAAKPRRELCGKRVGRPYLYRRRSLSISLTENCWRLVIGQLRGE